MKHTRILTLHILLLSLTLAGLSYDPLKDPHYAASRTIFDDASIPRISITLSSEDLGDILLPGNEESDVYYPAALRFTSPLVDDAITSVGVRLRGKIGRYARKKSFKISFNEFVRARQFHGLRKLNLNADHNDPSLIRTKLCWDLFNKFGVPAPRANHVRLYINGEYRGLYMNVENVDKIFVKTRFGNNSGNLYKCNYVSEQADLVFREDERYDLVGSGTSYEMAINQKRTDYSDLAHFIDILNNTPDHEIVPELEQVFNVEGFLKWMVVSIHTGSWDDYLWNGSNYYLYHNLETGKFEFIPYDYDMSFGIGSGEERWDTRDVYRFQHPRHPRPLATRILSQGKYMNMYSFLLNEFVIRYYSPQILEPRISQVKDMIGSAAEEDMYRTLDFGWSIRDFHRSYDEALGGNVTMGLKPFIRSRYEATLGQLRLFVPPPLPPAPGSAPPATPTPIVDCSTTPTLVINEICASNRTLISDDFGEYDDWIELYNYGGESLWLGGMYLSDDPSFPKKYRIPDSVLLPRKSHFLFWADGSMYQGPDHLPFRLRRAGEAVGLYDRDVCGNRKIDLIVFGPMERDISFGRKADVAPEWLYFEHPTPGESNTK